MIPTVLAFLKKVTLTQWLVAALLAALATQTARLALAHRATLAAEGKERTAQLAQRNAEARLDSTRQLTADSVKALGALLGDSLRLYQRQVVQQTIRADRLDKALGDAAVAHYALQVRVDSLIDRASAPVTESHDSLRATFHVDTVAYHVTAAVTLPKNATPPARGRLELAITQDPLALRLRVGCGASTDQGVRVATASITGPAYATLRLDSLVQAPEVCSPAPKALAAPKRGFWGTIWEGVKLAGMFGAGWLVGR